jgi:1,4-alpha-glucan branching enzyme
VRRYVLDNALMWLRDYHVDGLRVDAVHALVDERATHLLEELSTEVEALGAQLGKPLFLIAESDLNDARMVSSREAGGNGFDGQWADDVHHALHSNLTGRRPATTATSPGLPALAKVLTDVFLHDGQWSSFRGPGARPAGPVDRARAPVRRLPAGPRPGRQPGDRRPHLGDPVRRPAQGRRRAGAHLPVHPDAVDGRGVGRPHAVAVLLRPRGRPRRGGAPGPAGGYLPEFGPYLTEAHHTPWGPAVNLDRPGSEQVRRHILDSALMWLRDYHVDGLRIDAVHAFVDERATHLLEELSVEVEALGAQLRKPLFLIAESDLNDARMVTAREAGGNGLDGQWADDVHHALHANLSGEADRLLRRLPRPAGARRRC